MVERKRAICFLLLLLFLASPCALLTQSEVSFGIRRDFLGGGEQMAVGDFNGDAILDLALVNRNANNVAILIGNGDGTFQSAQYYGVGIAPSAVALADFNGDAFQDLAVANYNYGGPGDISIILGNGDGTFRSGRSVRLTDAPLFVVAVDLNEDNRTDLVVATYTGNVMSWIGNGDGTFRLVQTLPTGPDSRFLAVGDFNRDTHKDLVVNNGSILLGNGDGTFRRGQDLGLKLGRVIVEDFNGDGYLDLAVERSILSEFRSVVSILLGKGDGTFRPPQDFTFFRNSGLVAVGDFNGDRRLDLAITGNSWGVFIALGNGDGSFRQPGEAIVPLNATGGAGDFNGDNRADLALTGTFVSILLNAIP